MLLQILLVPIPACVLSRWRLVRRVALANTYLLAYWLVALFPIMPSVAFMFLFILTKSRARYAVTSDHSWSPEE